MSKTEAQEPLRLKLENVKYGNESSGSLITYLRRLTQAHSKGESDVPCNGCTACCRDPKLYVDLTEQEAQRLESHRGEKEWELDRNEKGECVYLIDNHCSIYSERPQSCRRYDCRIHLLGVPANSGQTILLQEGVLHWSPFSLPTVEDKVAHLAIMISIRKLLSKNPNPSYLEFGHAIGNWRAYREVAYEMYDAIRWMSEEELEAFVDRGRT